MEQIIHTIIVDDKKQPINHLETLLDGYKWISLIDKINDPEIAVNIILEKRPELIFLDIQMPRMTGFELVNELWKNNFKPDIIFVTAYDHFAIQAIRCAALDYLIKPVIPEELQQALFKFNEKKRGENYDERIQDLLKQTVNGNRIKLSTTGGFTMVKTEDIIHVQADWNYAEIFYDKENSDLVTVNIGSFEKMLPERSFFRISRSVIINTSYLTKVSRKKRTAILNKDGVEYSFQVPLLRIRALESFLEQ